MAASNSLPSFMGPRSRHTPIIVDTALTSHADESKTVTAARHAGTRAVTTFPFEKTDVQRLKTDIQRFITDEPLIPPAHTPWARTRKQPSTKHRLISRVMSGLTNKAHTSHAASREGSQTMQPPQTDALSSTSPVAVTLDVVRRSVSSAGTDDYGGSELDGTLSAFPTPPTATDTSPTSPTTTGFASSSRPVSQQYRSLRKPEDAAVLGVKLTLSPEYDQLSPDNGKSMFLAIDVKGALNTTTSGQNLWSQHSGLDVVMIIDNSLYTSPSCLMASCETARFLASILNIVTDRLAILCTSTFITEASESTTVWPLAPIKIHKLKTALDDVMCSSEKLTEDSWLCVIDRAKELLLQSVVPVQDTEVLQDTFGHVFLLTADTSGIPSSLLAHDRLHFHILCPAILPWKDGKSIASEGWRLRSLSANEPRAVSASKDTDPASLFNRIRGLISHARGGNLPGKLRDVSLEIVPGLDCSIEGVMGSSEWSTLHLGELHTVLVKLRVRTSKAKGYSLSQAIHQNGHPLDTDDVLGELDKMLGVSAVKVLTATLRYRHSLLPVATMCSVTVECQLNKQIGRLDDQRASPPRTNASPPMPCKVLVQKRLAYHLATHGSPRHALSNLRKEFGETGSRSFCPDYVNLIIKELKFQARIIERLTIDKSPKKPITDPRFDAPDSPFEHFGQGLFQAANYKPDDWITDAIDEGVSNNEEVQLAVLSNGKLADSFSKSKENKQKDKKPSKLLYAEPNEVKVIWDDIQKASKRQQARRAVSSSVEQDRQRRVRDLDGWVKESVRANPLRHVVSFGDSMRKGLGASRL